jgi:hypothetical protein
MKKNILFIFLFTSFNHLNAQDIFSKADSLYQNYYRSAYDEISNMAHEKSNLNFENAIFPGMSGFERRKCDS